MKPSLYIYSIFFFHFAAFGADTYCTIVDEPLSSSLKISYESEVPIAVSLKSPGESEYRTLMMNVEQVIKSSTGYESISATPYIDYEIDWSKEFNCYKVIGSQWYLELSRSNNQYVVSISPYYLKKEVSCRLPRNKPRSKALDCHQE